MKKTRADSQLRHLLLGLIDEAYDHTAWHGPNLKSAVRRVLPEEAVWRPRPGRKHIADLVVHCAYWKYAVRRRLLDQKRGSFPLKGSNWFKLPAKLNKTAWRDLVDLLDEQHRLLREAVAGAPLPFPSAGPDQPNKAVELIRGIALHDTYHAGQIRTLKVLYKQTQGGRNGRGG